MTPEDIREAAEKAEEDAMALLDELADIYAPDGVPYDQEEIRNDAEFIAWVLDLQQRPSPEFSVWTFLPSVSPQLFQKLTRDYEKAIAKQIGAR